MTFSYASIIYSESEDKVYSRGTLLEQNDRVEIVKSYNNGCKAVVDDGAEHHVALGFSRIGAPKYTCECSPYESDYVCEHIAATALAYDHSRNVFFKPYQKENLMDIL